MHDLYTIEEGAEITGLSEHGVRVWCAAKHVRIKDGAFKMSADLLYQLADDHGLEITLDGDADGEEEDEEADADNEDEEADADDEDEEADADNEDEEADADEDKAADD